MPPKKDKDPLRPRCIVFKWYKHQPDYNYAKNRVLKIITDSKVFKTYTISDDYCPSIGYHFNLEAVLKDNSLKVAKLLNKYTLKNKYKDHELHMFMADLATQPGWETYRNTRQTQCDAHRYDF